MNTLRLEEINLHSSYMVGQTEGNKYSFYSDTDFGLRYTISFMLEHSFVQSGAYQFCKVSDTLHSPLPSPPASEPAVPSGWVTAMPGLFSRAALNGLTA